MAAIYTTDWYDELRDLLNRNEEVEKNAPRGRLKVLAELRGDGQSLYLADGQRLFFVVHLDDGKCTDYYEVTEPPPRKDCDFIFEVPATVFEGAARGGGDPVRA